jgi:5-(carboxyamino)imidazole ribonucleotide synthase
MKAFYQNFTLGIVGGGQLGRMLLEPCASLDVTTAVLDPDSHAPCSLLAGSFQQGSLRDYDTVYAFGKQADLVTIEIENVNVEALYRLEAEGIPVYPQPRVIELIQDKRLQKQFYRDHNIPTPDFVLVNGREDILQHGDFLPAFNKLGKGGYDGGGVQRLNSLADIEKAFDAAGLLETFVDFDREISVIAARNAQGEVVTYPAVECVFHPEYNLVDYLLSPSNLPETVLQSADAIARHVVESLGIVGLLAVEMFVTREGEVLVNEVAPRPHNSGHQSREANFTSQYEQHLRAILGMPLGSTRLSSASAMVNLLGEEGYNGEVIYEGLDTLLAIEGARVTLYGKKLTKPQRKMGHVTLLADSRAALVEKVQQVRSAIRVIA